MTSPTFISSGDASDSDDDGMRSSMESSLRELFQLSNQRLATKDEMIDRLMGEGAREDEAVAFANLLFPNEEMSLWDQRLILSTLERLDQTHLLAVLKWGTILISPRMDAKEKKEILEILGTFRNPKIAETSQLLRVLIQPNMSAEEMRPILSELQTSWPDALPNILEILILCPILLKPETTPTEKQQIISWAGHVNKREIQTTADLVETMVTKEMPFAEMIHFIDTLVFNFRGDLHRVKAMAPQLMSPKMNGFVKAQLVKQIAEPGRDAIGIEISPIRSRHRGKKMSEWPRDLQWRLSIDRSLHEIGPFAFDWHENPGYHAAMVQCWHLFDQIRDYRIDSFLLQAIHDVSVVGVTKDSNPLETGYCPGWNYGIHTDWIDEDDVRLRNEWEEEKLILTPERERAIRFKYELKYSALPAGERMSLIERELEKYLAKIEWRAECHRVTSQFRMDDMDRIDRLMNQFYASAQNPEVSLEDQLAAIARCCRALLIYHPFPDGNGRTFCFVLLNLLLYQIGLPPAILSSPSLFNGSKTIPELVEAIKEGLDYFQKAKWLTYIGEYSGHVQEAENSADYRKLEEIYRTFHL